LSGILFIFNLSRFSKNKWSNQNFRQMYIWRHTPRRQAPAAVSHVVKSLLLWGAAARVWFLRQGGQRGATTLPPSGTTACPNRRATRRQGLFLFLKYF
jgi:hypothetical protein